jgi:hypothetical protein
VPLALVPFAVLLIGYLPSWAAARWCAARTGRPLGPRWLSPFPEILLGLCLWSWVGLLLAELGVFSPLRVGAILIGFSLVLALAARRGGHTAGGPGWRSPLAGLAIAIVAGRLYSPPYETIVMASDASIYFSTGVHLGREGSISVPDPLLGELGFAARAALLPLGRTVGWTRIPGGLLVRSGDTEVMWPTYFHLLPVWIATFDRLGGLEAGGLVGTMFAVLALWAIFLFAHETLGLVPAIVTTALVLTNAAELFYARFLMPEVLTQLFVWGGLLCFVVWWRHEWPAAGALAALALGVAGLTRVEYLFLVPLALVLQLGLAVRRPRGTWPFAALYVTFLAHGLAHLALVPTHYREVVQAELALLWSSFRALDARTTAALLAPLAAIVAAVVLLTRGGWRPRLRRAASLALAGAWVLGFVARSDSRLLPTLSWLAETAPWPLLALASLGLVLWARRWARDGAAVALPLVLFAVASATLLYDPHVTPSAIWALRRFVPVTLPFVYVLAASALPWRRSAAVAAALAAVLLVMNARPTAKLRSLPLFPDQKREVAALAARIDPGAVVFFAPELADYVIHLPLWLVHGRESFVLPPWDWRGALRAGALTLLARHAVYYVGAGGGEEPAVAGLEFAARGEARFRFVLPGPDLSRVPSGTSEWPLALRIYEVRRAAAR